MGVVENLPVCRDHDHTIEPGGRGDESVSGITMKLPGERESLCHDLQVNVKYGPSIICQCVVEPGPPMRGYGNPAAIGETSNLGATYG